ncbi:hypothetical protein AQUCO_03900058v1 [Aquilegia coerulea]|uniref:Receptor-like serine/threonine-protein kinase n=1 Tax=Aquilegia coerulea TaxID=218851 RepID=A0A2G5CRL0_AQUCA|nr:hypothetical protein AQUCO_03900058v1 [Aquilegia coerulea]
MDGYQEKGEGLVNDFCFAIATISPNKLIRDSDYITSLNQTFRLGFFSPGNSSNRYVGIWYNLLPGETVAFWVANRDNPLTDTSGLLRIHSDGNLVVLDGKEKVVWTTNVSAIATSSRVELLDSGNLLLREISSNESSNLGKILWQSFDHPTDTFIPNMKLRANTKTGEKQVMISWKTDSDPSNGRFHLELEPLNVPQLVIWEGSVRHWRSGPWDGRIFIGIEGMGAEPFNGVGIVRDEEEGNVYLTLSYTIPTYERYVVNSVGQLTGSSFVEEENRWVRDWFMPETECDYYGKCGSFGFCNLLSKPICSCLKGYEPSLIEEWSKGNWSSGCLKRKPFRCEQNNSSSEERKEDRFVKHEGMKAPDHIVNWVRGGDMESSCKEICLMNCSCSAYSYDINVGCMWWHGNLIDMQKFSTNGVDLYIRVAHSELDEKKNMMLVYIIIVLTGLTAVLIGMYIFRRWAMKKKRKTYMGVSVLGTSDTTKDLSDTDKLDPELPIFKYDKLQVSTNNFDPANKLGEGGFGSVYMGKLPSGQEIAVKRLSKSSGQGTKEFKNEVVVISKLQHRNLVRLLGCCIEGEEKMLVYEYMPNKSLDAFLFDPKKKALLGWKKCFQIIEGIGRGILYLHRDSRLRVIHRDLKPSNILLDKDLNPKISDFGIARIFGRDELQATTRRVVGTYGYMSPEYAMEGLFSEKSDVYSFGVLLLEIVSGMRNTGFYQHEESVWKMWNENKIQMLIDPAISDLPCEEEILRCIHVGLLCVQDLAKDRPSMSSTISMLFSEISSLPTPKQPAFSGREVTSYSDSSHSGNKFCSRNYLSITIEGR